MNTGVISNLYLLGFMGAGKSTVGAAIARKMGWEFLDTDLLLTTKFGSSIEALFESKGESFFRDAEAQLIWDLSQRSHQVVAFGGGSLLRSENQEFILNRGRCIFLQARVETLVERLLGSHMPQLRPLLKGLCNREQLARRVAQLLEARSSIYEKAHFTLTTDEKTVAEVVEELAYYISEN